MCHSRVVAAVAEVGPVLAMLSEVCSGSGWYRMFLNRIMSGIGVMVMIAMAKAAIPTPAQSLNRAALRAVSTRAVVPSALPTSTEANVALYHVLCSRFGDGRCFGIVTCPLGLSW